MVPISKVRNNVVLGSTLLSTLTMFHVYVAYQTRLRHCKEQGELAEQVMNISHE